MLLLHGQEGARIGDGGGDLQAIAHDPGVGEQPADLARVVAGDAAGVEAVEGGAVRAPLVEDGFPGQPGLRALEDEHLEQAPVVTEGDAPLRVVIGGLGRAPRPVAAAAPVPFHRERLG